MAHDKLTGLALLFSVACSSAGPAGSTPPPPPPPSNPTPTTAVDVRDNAFSPPAAQVDVGATVTWTWRGGNDHNVTFESGSGSSTTKSSGNHQRTFTTAGTVRYRCTIHSSDFGGGMSGSVVVQ
jgi:plastocyanin